MNYRNQNDLVKARLEAEYREPDKSRRVKLPGIEKLHTRPIIEIAEVLANVLRMEKNLTKFEWVIGSHIELYR